MELFKAVEDPVELLKTLWSFKAIVRQSLTVCYMLYVRMHIGIYLKFFEVFD